MSRALVARPCGIRGYAPNLNLAALTGGWSDGREVKITDGIKAQERDVRTTVAASGNNTGIVVPDEVIGQLAAGKRPPARVKVNGYEYRNTVGVMGGRH